MHKEVNNVVITEDLHLLFATFTGDKNPIHVSKIIARRLVFGRRIVHGIHVLLLALESYYQFYNQNIACIKFKFIKPIFINVELKFILLEKYIYIKSIDDEILTTIEVIISDNDESFNDYHLNIKNHFSEPVIFDLSKIKFHNKSDFIVSGNPDLAKALFPTLFFKYGIGVVSEIGALSFLVGMKCPGMNSLFGGGIINIQLQVDKPYYSIVNYYNKFNLLKIQYAGFGIIGSLDAFIRNTTDKFVNFHLLENLVLHKEFEKVNALIIGGSRGVGGEIAKLISLGGGNVTITYDIGLDDSIKLQKEILIHCGKKIKIIQYSASNKLNVEFSKSDFNQIYYMASPKIINDYKNSFNNDLYNIYREIYNKCFLNLIKKVVISKAKYKTNIFYPSTVFLNSNNIDFFSYKKNKLIGERLCRMINRRGSVLIIYPRLPKMNTDQNLSIFGFQKLEEVAPTMLRFIRDMCNQ